VAAAGSPARGTRPIDLIGLIEEPGSDAGLLRARCAPEFV